MVHSVRPTEQSEHASSKCRAGSAGQARDDDASTRSAQNRAHPRGVPAAALDFKVQVTYMYNGVPSHPHTPRPDEWAHTSGRCSRS